MDKMNGERSDASTSTDDLKGRPLCLFYFTHPFGVLSPDPPTIAAAPENITQAFINMKPVSPDFWSSTQDTYATSSSTTSKVNYEIGNVTIPKKPVSIVKISRNLPKCTIDLNFRRDNISSSFLSSDIFLSSSSSRSCDYSRRIIPYNRTLPPLELPVSKDYIENLEDQRSKKIYNREKFSLPPINMPQKKKKKRRKTPEEYMTGRCEKVADVIKSEVKIGKVRGVKKVRRRSKLSSVRRTLNCLMQRAVKGESVLVKSLDDDVPRTSSLTSFTLVSNPSYSSQTYASHHHHHQSSSQGHMVY
ncbi:hypothetical protein EVAR_3956_1 [Eumeta japonica]|uniref:Uncharacterized protein n=1 Tax=Eumeta variegata TaxID=151549 RepID=A0A4C1SRT0_EUMVA|nr:hypothetical protein EVAR_3956_1 [Eumeta japonica]